MSHSKSNLEQMLRVIEKAELRVLAPKPASLWLTSAYELEERSDLSIDTRTGRHRFPSEEKFQILGCAVNRQGKANDGIEECNPQTRLGGERSTFTEDWWNKSRTSSSSG